MKEERGKGKANTEMEELIVYVQGCFLSDLYPYGCEREGVSDKFESQVGYSIRLNHMKFLFLKVRSGLIPAISYGSTTYYEIKADDNVKHL